MDIRTFNKLVKFFVKMRMDDTFDEWGLNSNDDAHQTVKGFEVVTPPSSPNFTSRGKPRIAAHTELGREKDEIRLKIRKAKLQKQYATVQ